MARGDQNLPIAKHSKSHDFIYEATSQVLGFFGAAVLRNEHKTQAAGQGVRAPGRDQKVWKVLPFLKACVLIDLLG